MAESWEAVLDQLETDLALAEAVLADEASLAARGAVTETAAAWLPPSALGPLPQELAARAHDLAAAQVELAHRLERARRRAGRHLAALDAVPTPPQPVSFFVDAQG